MKEITEYIKLPLIDRQQHLSLTENCIIRGGNSVQFRGLLAYYLNTTIPYGMKIQLCHACHNGKCSNPNHLYWGTPKENYNDAVSVNRHKKQSKKYGKDNHNYKLEPWNNANKSPECWKKAGYIYDNYVIKQWDFTAYGKSYGYFIKKYNIKQGPARTMIKWFKDGWNPYADEKWLDFYNNE